MLTLNSQRQGGSDLISPDLITGRSLYDQVIKKTETRLREGASLRKRQSQTETWGPPWGLGYPRVGRRKRYLLPVPLFIRHPQY